MENTYGYFAKDVAASLDITTSTLRRWSIELENKGYNFDRNEKNRRIYFERDFVALRELKKLIGNNVTFADAINAVVSTDFEKKNAQKTPTVYNTEIRLCKHELEEIVNRAVTDAIEKDREKTFQVFEEKLNQEIERRESLFMAEIKKEQEEKQQLIEAAAKKEEESQGPEENAEQDKQKAKKRSFFQRIFNR